MSVVIGRRRGRRGGRRGDENDGEAGERRVGGRVLWRSGGVCVLLDVRAMWEERRDESKVSGRREKARKGAAAAKGEGGGSEWVQWVS